MSYAMARLSPDDLPRLRQLNRVFSVAFDDPRSYESAAPGDDYLRRLLAKPSFFAVVAIADVPGPDQGHVVGGLVAYELEKFEQERSEIYIYDLAVSEAHRRRGVARRLIAELVELARRRGAYVVYVQADHGDMPAIKLYESMGTREDVYHFDIDVIRAWPPNPPHS
jgi:aminoglycoside 3-N-acetyltransferase I